VSSTAASGVVKALVDGMLLRQSCAAYQYRELAENYRQLWRAMGC
jgi:hypothetical protein